MATKHTARRKKTALESTAYHEAGHAVANWRQHIALRREGVTIVPVEGALGSCSSRRVVGADIEWDASDKNRIQAEKKVLSLLAGEIAQRRYNPRSVRHYHGSSDRHLAADILDHFVGSPAETDAYLQMLRIRATTMLSNPDVWRAVERLAAALMDRRTIPGKEATQIIRDAFLRICMQGTPKCAIRTKHCELGPKHRGNASGQAPQLPRDAPLNER